MKEKFKVPMIVLWPWMRTVLDLSGVELNIFAFLYEQTYDGSHECYTPLTDMEMCFGVTRQAISRNIDKLVEKGFVSKITSQNKDRPVIKHNRYHVNMMTITKLCESADLDDYKNFLDSYSGLLKQRFPEEDQKIDFYISELLRWHETKDIKVCFTISELIKAFNSEEISTTDFFTKLTQVTSCPTTSSIEQELLKPKKKTTQKSLFAMPKRRSKIAQKNEWLEEKRQASHSFVYMNAGGNKELLDYLYKFLETDNGMSYTPSQWQCQLDNLYRFGRTSERMIQGVKTTFMNNYRSLYLVDKSEVDIDLKLDEVEKYVASQGECNEELLDLLRSYVLEVPKGKSSSVKQFMLSLENLTNLCPTLEEKIASVKTSYMNSYAALAYPKGSTSRSNTSDVSTDMEQKHQEVKQFITNGGYEENGDLEKSLNSYVDNCQSGRSMSLQDFKSTLQDLRLYCFDDHLKVSKVEQAIKCNYNRLALEDYAETKQIKKRGESREKLAHFQDVQRKQSLANKKNQEETDIFLAKLAERIL